MDSEWFKKPFNEVSEDDMNIFILNLERGIIKSSKGEPYTWETQSTIKKFIRKYYKYLLGENDNYPKLVQFIDTSTRILEIKSLSKQENDKLIKKYGILKPNLSIRNMRARWGSCVESKKIILLNNDLIEAPKFCIDYVILHELIHFKYKNHDKKFYGLQESIMPDWKKRKEILDTEVVRSL